MKFFGFGNKERQPAIKESIEIPPSAFEKKLSAWNSRVLSSIIEKFGNQPQDFYFWIVGFCPENEKPHLRIGTGFEDFCGDTKDQDKTYNQSAVLKLVKNVLSSNSPAYKHEKIDQDWEGDVGYIDIGDTILTFEDMKIIIADDKSPFKEFEKVVDCLIIDDIDYSRINVSMPGSNSSSEIT